MQKVPRYKLVPLGNPNPCWKFLPGAISPNGQCIAGHAVTRLFKEPQWKAVLWKNGVFYHASDERYLQTISVNDQGVICGRYLDQDQDPEHQGRRAAAICHPSKNNFSSLSPHRYAEGNIERLFPPNGESSAQYIDNAGNIYGSHRQIGGIGASHAYIRNAQGTITYLDSDPEQNTYPMAINENNHVLLERHSVDWSESRTMIWENGSVHELPTLGTKPTAFGMGKVCEAHGINNHGDVVGYCTTTAGVRAPVIWRNGDPERLPLPEGKEGIALRINDQGNIVGSTRETQEAPFLIHQGKFHLINDLVDSNIKVRFVRQILNDDSILVMAQVKGANRLPLFLPRQVGTTMPDDIILLKPR